MLTSSVNVSCLLGAENLLMMGWPTHKSSLLLTVIDYGPDSILPTFRMLILHISFKTWVILPSMPIFQMSHLMLRRPEWCAPSSTSNKKSWSPGICPEISNPNSSSGSCVIKSRSQSRLYSGSPSSGSFSQTYNLSSLSPVIPSVSLVTYFWYPLIFSTLSVLCQFMFQCSFLSTYSTTC